MHFNSTDNRACGCKLDSVECAVAKHNTVWWWWHYSWFIQ